MRATLIVVVRELTRPIYSSIILGILPVACTMEGPFINTAIGSLLRYPVIPARRVPGLSPLFRYTGQDLLSLRLRLGQNEVSVVAHHFTVHRHMENYFPAVARQQFFV